MSRIPVSVWLEKTIRAKQSGEIENKNRIERENNLIREIKIIQNRQKQILRRLDNYGERLHNLEQNLGIADNAANNSVIEAESGKRACKILQYKTLKTFDFMDDKLDKKCNEIYNEIKKLKNC